MIIEKNVMVRVRDGHEIAVDVFRPADGDAYPVIVSMSPYGKDVHWPDRFPLYDQVDQSEHMAWETENPERWISEGYVVVRADTRGSGESPGVLDLLAQAEQNDAYDVVEWAGVQPWSNGRVGMSGISWYGMIAWHVAAMRPPHLAAVIPWDGLTDFYREWAYPGGVLQNNLTPSWWAQFVATNQYDADVLTEDELAAQRRSLADEIREHREAAEVPRGEQYALDIEVWPTSIVLQRGHRLVLEIATSDTWHDSDFLHDDPVTRHQDVIGGTVALLSGGAHDSQLLLPVIVREDATDPLV